MPPLSANRCLLAVRGLPYVLLTEDEPHLGPGSKAANPETIRRKLENGLKNPAPKTPLGRAIKAKKTIRFGNKADPYQPIEKTSGVSRQIPIAKSEGVTLVSPGLPGLSELCRMLTWDYIARNTAFKLINDGGGLDRPGLEQFKDKLCPDHKLNVPTTKE